MSARPGDWSLLQLSGDPVPGDEFAVARQAGHYQTVAEAITDQISNLRKISHGNAQGLYVDKLTDDAKDIANDLSKVHNRFDTVASQLKVWQPVLADARSKSAALLRQAEAAHSSMSANQPPDKPLPDDATDAQVSAEKSRSQNYSSAQTELDGYVRQMKTELEHVRSVAHRVASKINDASSDDVEDSWWDSHVRKWIQDHAHLIDIIVKVLEIVAIVIAVAALVLMTGGGALVALGVTAEALAAASVVVDTAALVVGGALLLGHAAEMNAGVNDVGWVDIGLDVLSLVTFGASKFLGKGAETALGAAKSGAVSDVTRAAERGLAPNVQNALRIGSETNPLRVWAAGERTSAIAAARASLESSLETLPRSLAISLVADTDLAKTYATARALQNYPSAAAAASTALKWTRLGIGVSAIDRLHFVYDSTKVPKTLQELFGGGGTKDGG